MAGVFGFRSELVTSAGLHLRARELDTSLAAFLTVDPIDGSPGLPVETSAYHYANNDPVNHVDPLGLKPIRDGGLRTGYSRTDEVRDLYMHGPPSARERQFEAEFGVLPREIGITLPSTSLRRVSSYPCSAMCFESHKLAARAYGISANLLWTVIQHEGSGRARVTDVPVIGQLYRMYEDANPPVVGQDSVGVGQMHPANAAAMSLQFNGRRLTTNEARSQLAYDDYFGVEMAAAYLRNLKDTYGLTDRQAFIAYAFSSSRIERMMVDGWDIYTEARNRAARFDYLSGTGRMS